MKMIPILLVFFSLYSCAVIQYAPKTSENSKGYWSKKIQTGIYKVYSNYDNSTSPKRAMGYILIRGYELCAQEKKKYFYYGIVSENTEFDHPTLSANIYCQENQSRLGFGAKLAGNSNRVEEVLNYKGQKLIPNDKIISLNKKRVASRNDLEIILYNLKNTRKNMRVIVERKNKKMLLKFKPIVRKDILSSQDVTNIAFKWYVPLNTIKGLYQ